MWPFGRAKLDERDLERLRELERKIAVMEVEWSDWFDRYRRLYAKIAKRAAEAPEVQPPEDRSADGILDDPNHPTHPAPGWLSPDMLRRRRQQRGF